ncbi:MAG: glycoside hydrolase [Planctomycetota bacterium]|nr:MAG: glycoside hydrolase [Planctomycetota bacterium]
MGVLRFRIEPPSLIPSGQAPSAYITGADGRVHTTRCEIQDGVLSLHRLSSESSTAHVTVSIPERGQLVLSTTSLPERDAPYHLGVELLRGCLGEVREQACGWELARMNIPERFRSIQRQAFHCLATACGTQTEPDHSNPQVLSGLKLALNAADVLIESYVMQRTAGSRTHQTSAPTLVGCTLDATALQARSEFTGSFNAARIPIEWRWIEPVEGEYQWELLDHLIERCIDPRMAIIGGPLLDFTSGGLPKWLVPWAGDIVNLPSFVCDFVETAINRYTGRIRMWEVAAYGNLGGALSLSEEHRLTVMARAMETAYRTDSDAQFFVRVGQPWGEYLAQGNHRLSPFQLVDALLRSHLGLTGVTLEIAMGYGPPGSLTRTRMAVSRLIDQWSQLGIQLHVVLACPSAIGPDPAAYGGCQVLNGTWRLNWSEEAQAAWLEEFLPMIAAKPAVTGVFLNSFGDSLAHRYPHSGMLRPDGTAKPSLQFIEQHRNSNL